MTEVLEQPVLWIVKRAFGFQAAYTMLGFILLYVPLIPFELNGSLHVAKVARLPCSVKHYTSRRFSRPAGRGTFWRRSRCAVEPDAQVDAGRARVRAPL